MGVNPFKDWTPQQVAAHNAKHGQPQTADQMRAEVIGHYKFTPNQSPPKKRIRQDTKPLMNKLEREWFNVLSGMASTKNLRAQALRFKLANGLWFKVDITCEVDGKMTCFEVKGPFAFRGGFENLKSAATLFAEWDWFLVWKDGGQWKTQKILP